jgi:thiol:disulfide interchange protein DsbD
VVAGFALLLFAVGLNLSGVFTVGTSIMGLGGSLAERRGISGSFFTGVLAVVVAAPCTAPFMGLALGFALTQPALIGLAIFMALGFGMALPYLALSFAPALLRLLPRPGAWMERLKQVLAVPIYAWVVYLLWVFAQQAGLGWTGVMLGLLALLALTVWGFERFHRKDEAPVAHLAALGTLVAVMGAIVLVLPRGGADLSAGAAIHAEAFPAVPYSEDALADLRADNRTVFVNFTAAWCITCLLNERVAFSDPAVAARFESEDVVYMVGDWTNRDAEIARALERFGRPGVPLYVVYRPGEAPHVLPQVLTPDIVLNAIED